MNSSLNKKKQSAIPLGRLWFHHDYQFGRLHLQLLMMWCGCLYLNHFLAAWSKQLLCFPFQDHCELLIVNCSAQQLTGNTAVQLKPCYWLMPKGILSFLKNHLNHHEWQFYMAGLICGCHQCACWTPWRHLFHYTITYKLG